MIDHISIKVGDYRKSRKFYDAALKPLGYALVMEFGQAAGLGEKGKPDFWIVEGPPGVPIHLAFACSTRATVDAFYREAMKAGAKDNGRPGLRAHYHPNYYGAFVFDPDGNNIEAVCHLPQAGKASARAPKAPPRKAARKAPAPKAKAAKPARPAKTPKARKSAARKRP